MSRDVVPVAHAAGVVWESVAGVQAAAVLLLSAGDQADSRCERRQARRFYDAVAGLDQVACDLRRLAMFLDSTPTEPVRVAECDAVLGPVRWAS